MTLERKFTPKQKLCYEKLLSSPPGIDQEFLRNLAFIVVTTKDNFGVSEQFLRLFQNQFDVTPELAALKQIFNQFRIKANDKSVSDVTSKWELAFTLLSKQDEVSSDLFEICRSNLLKLDTFLESKNFKIVSTQIHETRKQEGDEVSGAKFSVQFIRHQDLTAFAVHIGFFAGLAFVENADIHSLIDKFQGSELIIESELESRFTEVSLPIFSFSINQGKEEFAAAFLYEIQQLLNDELLNEKALRDLIGVKVGRPTGSHYPETKLIRRLKDKGYTPKATVEYLKKRNIEQYTKHLLLLNVPLDEAKKRADHKFGGTWEPNAKNRVMKARTRYNQEKKAKDKKQK